MIYFLRIEWTGNIKIGTTVCLPDRLKSYARKGRLTILGVCDGGFPEEKVIHHRFAHLRLKANGHGRNPELFRPDPDLMEYIAKNSREPDLLDQLHEDRGKLWVIRLALPREAHREFRQWAAGEETNMALLARRIILDAIERRRREEKRK